MHVIETMSTLDVGRSLGLQPVTVRRMIRDGRLTAVRIGKSWRVRVDSVNALLSGDGRTLVKGAIASEHTAPAIAPPNLHVAAAEPRTTPASMTTPPATKPRFSDSDMLWINRYRREAQDPDRDVAANARWQLEQFEKRANDEARWDQHAQHPSAAQALGNPCPCGAIFGSTATRRSVF